MKEDEYIQLDFSDITADPNLTRREFLKCLGGGIIIFFCIGDIRPLFVWVALLPTLFTMQRAPDCFKCP